MDGWRGQRVGDARWVGLVGRWVVRGAWCACGALSGLEDFLLWFTWGDAPGWYRLLLWSRWWVVRGVGVVAFSGLEDVLLWFTWGDAPGWYRLLLWSKW